MLERLTISLSEPERVALERVAASDLRSIRDEARIMLRRELQRLGFLKVEDPTDQTSQTSKIENEARAMKSGDNKRV